MRFRHRTLLLATLTLAALLGATAASAQDQREPNKRLQETSGNAAAVPQAPVGHRQPRATDLPAARPSEQEQQLQRDREFDKKLRICRGC